MRVFHRGYVVRDENAMLFRPSFCANCGEKVERAEWGLLTSRRFCQVCESEFKGYDLLPRIMVGFGVLGGIVGFGSYLDGGAANERGKTKPSQLVTQKLLPSTTSKASTVRTESAKAEATPPSRPPLRSETSQQPGPPSNVRPVISEPAYMCGAETKKGTPCSRRVKGRTRCYQHAGMPSMMTAGR
jgi:hypothetical protein